MKTIVKANSNNQLDTCNLSQTSQVNKVMKPMLIESRSEQKEKVILELECIYNPSEDRNDPVLFLVHKGKLVGVKFYFTYEYFKSIYHNPLGALAHDCFLGVYYALSDCNIDFVIKTNLDCISNHLKFYDIKVDYNKNYKLNYNYTEGCEEEIPSNIEMFQKLYNL